MFTFSEPPICLVESNNGSCDVIASFSVDVTCLSSLFADGTVSVRTVVVVVVSPSLPIRLIVRYSVIVFPDGFGAKIGGAADVCCGIGEARVINCLRSLSTVT